jgi:hypothetical protein
MSRPSWQKTWDELLTLYKQDREDNLDGDNPWDTKKDVFSDTWRGFGLVKFLTTQELCQAIDKVLGCGCCVDSASLALRDNVFEEVKARLGEEPEVPKSRVTDPETFTKVRDAAKVASSSDYRRRVAFEGPEDTTITESGDGYWVSALVWVNKKEID